MGLDIFGDEELESPSVSTAESLKPFAAFGSYRQRHGSTDDDHLLTNGITNGSCRAGISSEAPAALGDFSLLRTTTSSSSHEITRSSSMPLNIPQPTRSNGLRRKTALRSSRISRSDQERELAWERKRDQQKREEELKRAAMIREEEDMLANQQEISRARAVGRSVSDCGDRTAAQPRLIGKSSVLRTRSLTDEDLDELRGSIDLGFGFSNQADPQLWNTLPALELCYAINQQYQSRASPSSTLDDSLDATSDLGSSPMGSPSWTISSPGDNPQLVKTRIRHWAQAVACTVQQNLKRELC